MKNQSKDNYPLYFQGGGGVIVLGVGMVVLGEGGG